MNRHAREGGTSLIEVLAAVAIFGVIAAGSAVGTIATMRGNTAGRDITAAAALIHDKVEQLRALDPAALPVDLRAGVHVDPSNPLSELGNRGGTYVRTWMVTTDSPVKGLSVVVVTVTWKDPALRTLSGATYVCRTEACT